jgi:hypothetical protein
VKWVVRVAFHPHPQHEGDMILCAPTAMGMLPRAIAEFSEWAVQVEIVQDWIKVTEL